MQHRARSGLIGLLRAGSIRACDDTALRGRLHAASGCADGRCTRGGHFASITRSNARPRAGSVRGSAPARLAGVERSAYNAGSIDSPDRRLASRAGPATGALTQPRSPGCKPTTPKVALFASRPDLGSKSASCRHPHVQGIR
jgi:hypothetical protein